MIVLQRCEVIFYTDYHRVDSLEEISDKLRFIGKDGKYDVYFGKSGNIYFVEADNGKMDGDK